MNSLLIHEAVLTDPAAALLIRLSQAWEAENSCHGYRQNGPEDLAGRRVWLAERNGETVGYLFGIAESASFSSTVMEKGAPCFEIEEIYVVPACRGQGVGQSLFRAAEAALRQEGNTAFLTLSTATKNWRAILHFYLDELGMTFWNARLFKPLK